MALRKGVFGILPVIALSAALGLGAAAKDASGPRRGALAIDSRGVDLSLVELEPCPDTKATGMGDLFFPVEVYVGVYDQWRSSAGAGAVPGGLVSCAFSGQVLSIQEVSEVAREILRRRADALGIPREKVSEAILLGVLAPAYPDLHMAYEGGGLEPEWQTRNTMASNFEFYRPLWNAEFGALRDAPPAPYLLGEASTIDDVFALHQRDTVDDTDVVELLSSGGYRVRARESYRRLRAEGPYGRAATETFGAFGLVNPATPYADFTGAISQRDAARSQETLTNFLVGFAGAVAERKRTMCQGVNTFDCIPYWSD